MIRFKFFVFIIMAMSLFSCGTSVMITRDPGKEISKSIRKTISTTDYKKYKRMKACEEKYMRRFSKLYAKQQRQDDNTDFSTPFFSSNANINR